MKKKIKGCVFLNHSLNGSLLTLLNISSFVYVCAHFPRFYLAGYFSLVYIMCTWLASLALLMNLFYLYKNKYQ
jgi:hypothetical protein